MKKINWKNVAKGIALSPVYCAGFTYGMAKYIIEKTTKAKAVPSATAEGVAELDNKLRQHKSANKFWQQTLYSAEQNPAEQALAESVQIARAAGVPEQNIIHNNAELDALIQEGGKL